MKKLCLFLAIFPALLFAQQDSTKKRACVKVISISIYGGMNMFRGGFEDRTVFQRAAPSSSLAYADLTGYDNMNSMYQMYNWYGNSIQGVLVNLRLRCMPRFSQLRLGIQFGSTSISSQSYNLETTTSLGSTSLPGGGMLYSDSIYTSTYSYDWNSDFLNLDLGWIVSTKQARILSVYTGFGAFAGIGFNGIIRNSLREESHLIHNVTPPASGAGMYYMNPEVHTSLEENFRAPVFGNFGAYVPIGINVRLGKRNNFLKHVVLFGEYQGTIQFIAPSGVDLRIRTSSSMNTGIKWLIHPPRGKGKHHHHEKHDGQGK